MMDHSMFFRFFRVFAAAAGIHGILQFGEHVIVKPDGGIAVTENCRPTPFKLSPSRMQSGKDVKLAQNLPIAFAVAVIPI